MPNVNQTSNNSSTNLDLPQWLDRFNNTEMPVLASAVNQLGSIAQNEHTSANQLAEVILKDANLTSKVLKIANSATYSIAGSDTSTISHAVVILGFETVRSISISAMLVDKLSSSESKNELMDVLSDAFHSATQARGLCAHLSTEEQEEVYVAALLSNVGEMVFWSENGPEAEKLSLARRDFSTDEELNEREILGVSFSNLSRGMAEKWSLGPLLNQMLDPKSKGDNRVQGGRLGVALNKALKQGRDSDAFRSALIRAAKFTGIETEQLLKDINARILETWEIAKASGIKNTTALERIGAPGIPESETPEGISQEPLASSKSEEESKAENEALERSPSQGKSRQDILLNVLFELSALIQSKANITSLFQLSLEGLIQGVGLERAAICMLDVKTKTIQARYVLGKSTEPWLQSFCFPVDTSSVFGKALQNAGSQSLKLSEPSGRDDQVSTILTTGDYFLSSLAVGERVVGIYYADGNSKLLGEEQFRGFQHLVQQINMGLMALAQK